MRMHTTVIFLLAALVAGAVGLSGLWEGASSAATVVYFICMNLVALTLVAGPYGQAPKRAAADLQA